MTIYFDMDGTIADLYGVENWLDYLINSDATPYKVAKPLINLNSFARVLNNKQRKGVKIGVISWLSKNGSDEYNELVTRAKIEWLKKHLKSVNFDEVHIVKYGTPKVQFKKNFADVLFDDECGNRAEWGENAFDVNDIIEILKGM